MALNTRSGGRTGRYLAGEGDGTTEETAFVQAVKVVEGEVGGDPADAAGTPINRSGVAGSSSSQVMAANPDRIRFSIQLPSDATANIWICEMGPATASPPSWELRPGDTIVDTYKNAITVISAGTDQAYSAREYV